MNIVILQGAFFPVPPLLGGAVEKMWFKLGQEFAALGNKVTHLSRIYPSLPLVDEIEGVYHKRIKGYDAPNFKLLYNFYDAIYSWRAIKELPADTDVVITNSFWSPIFLRVIKKPIVYIDVARMPKGQMKFYSRADCLRANSSAVVNAIKDELPECDHNRIGFVPNPLPFKFAQTTDFDINNKKKIILYCGRIHQEKGLELLAQALKKIDLVDWEVKMVGPWDIHMGGGGKSYKTYLEDCFDCGSIEFVGPVFDENKLNNYYREATIFVYPSIAEKGETFGSAPLEAMAWGAIPIVSNLECFKDFIIDRKNGLIFNHRCFDASDNLASAIKLITDDAELRKKLAVNSISVRESHSITNIAKQFILAFQSLVDKKNI